MIKTKKGRDFWGPPCWATLHIFAASYTPDKEHAFKMFLESLTKLLPCEICKEHLKANLQKIPVERYLRNNYTLFLWSYILHDAVNQQHNAHAGPNKIQKRSPDYNEVKDFYFRGLAEECKECKLY
jgi:hypothetical protein